MANTDKSKPIDISRGPVEIELVNSNNEKQVSRKIKYRILEILPSRGRTCVCYKAEKIIRDNKTQLVILKVFYPYEDSSAFEIENGIPLISDFNAELLRKYNFYIKSVKKLKDYMTEDKYKDIRKYLCVGNDVEPLYSINNLEKSTVYYENLYFGELYWLNAKDDKDVGLSQIMQTSISVMDFLKKLHEIDDGLAYVDIKPEDVLIKCDEMGTINFSEVLFFDLEYTLQFGIYDFNELRKCTTPRYRPGYFKKEKEVEIGRSSDNCTYAKGVDSMVRGRIDMDEGEVLIESEEGTQTTKKILSDMIVMKGNSKYDIIAGMDENEIIRKLDDVKQGLEKDEKENREVKYLPKYDRNRKICSFILVGLYILLSISVYSALTSNKIGLTYIGIDYGIVIFSFLCIVIDTILIYYFAQKYSHTLVSVNYYDEKNSEGDLVRDSDYNTFRLGTLRNKTTFEDKGKLHKIQQGARHLWWIALGLGICVGCVWISIVFKSLPFFFVVGILLILIFMWADYLPACKRDFKAYYNFVKYDCSENQRSQSFYGKYCTGFDESRFNEQRLLKAIFYGDEYIDSLAESNSRNPFYIHSRYYYNSRYCRDMSRMREWIVSTGFSEGDSWTSFIKYLPHKNYDDKVNYAKENQISLEGKKRDVDLHYSNLQMKQTYKMTFDRLKNEQLISNLIIFTLTLLVVAFVGLHTSESGIIYSCLPEKHYLTITIMLLVIATALNVCQSFNAKNYERLVAEMAYKSRFIKNDFDNFTLNELIVRDIAIGCIKPIDIERGTTRYQGSIIGGIVDASNDEKNDLNDEKDLFKNKNRPLLHFKYQARKRHLIIMVWCIFIMAFSIVVWMKGILWMGLPLLIIAVVTQCILDKLVLTNFGKRKLISNIERYIKESEDRTKKYSE